MEEVIKKKIISLLTSREREREKRKVRFTFDSGLWFWWNVDGSGGFSLGSNALVQCHLKNWVKFSGLAEAGL